MTCCCENRIEFMRLVAEGHTPSEAMELADLSADELMEVMQTIEAAALVIAMRRELAEPCRLTPEHLESVRVVTLPLVETVNGIGAQMDKLGDHVMEQKLILEEIAQKLGIDLDAPRQPNLHAVTAKVLKMERGKK